VGDLKPLVETGVKIALAIAWFAHVLSWLVAALKVRRLTARRSELPREIAIRFAMIGLIVWALWDSSGAWIPLSLLWVGLLTLLAIGGHILAIVGRHQLGMLWGIGVDLKGSQPGGSRDGLYRRIPHPIYLGTMTAIGAQVSLLQNTASIFLLTLGLVLVVPKVIAENARLRLNQE